jgi:hypothetical protein
MPAEIVNLNKQRKERAKQERKDKADANSIKFGRSKAEKERTTRTLAQEKDRLDGHKREP